MGAESILWELWAQNVLRFFGGARGHEQPFLYYFTHFWVTLWPWSWLFPVSLIWIWRGSLRQDRNVQLLLWWLGTFLVFLSMAATKRHVYLLPAYPAVAMLMGPWVARWTEPAERGDAPYGARAIGAWALAMAVVSASLGVLFLALAVGGTSVIEIVRPDAEAWPVITHLRVPAFIVGSVLLGSVWFLGNSWRRRDRAASLSAVAMTYGLLYVLSQALVMPAFEPLKTFRPQSQWILARVPGGEPTALLDLNGYAERRRAAFAYYLGAPMGKLETRGDVEGFFAEHPGSLVLIEERSWGRVAPTDGIWERRVERELEASGETYRVLRGPGWP
jgi:4-amino-4-deoxy-L-arabinose transferase-like glycosyltransferase